MQKLLTMDRVGRPLAASIWLLVGCATAAAHPFHISTAEMEWNAQSRRFEVSLKVHASDIERALGQLVSRKVNIEQEPGAKDLLTRYLAGHFYLVDKQSVASKPVENQPVNAKLPATSIEPIASHQNVEPGHEAQRSRLHFVGSELESTWLWLYFELEPPAKRSELVLVNAVLVDLVEGQINTVTLRSSGEKQTLTTTAKKPIAESEFLINSEQ